MNHITKIYEEIRKKVCFYETGGVIYVQRFRVEEVQEIVKKISELDGCEIKSLMPEFVVGWSGRA